MDLEAIFDGKPPAPVPEIQPAETPPPAAVEAPANAAAAPEPQPEPAPVPQPKEDRTAPLAALLDERDKRKAAESRLAELEAQRRQQTAPGAPDPYDDLDGYAAHVDQRLQQVEIQTRLNTSNLIARQAHGNETVQAALVWAQEKAGQDPTFEQRMIADSHPVDWVVRQHKQEADLTDYRTDPVAFARRVLEAAGQLPATDAGAGTTPVPGQQQAPKPAAPPRSIASAASATGTQREIATGPLAALDALFKG